MSSAHTRTAPAVVAETSGPARRTIAETKRAVAQASSSPARRRIGPLAIGAMVFLTLWAVAATGFSIIGQVAVARLTDEQADLRVAYDEKVKALTRRLVGVASHQVLEQDGLSGRLADIISRQVQLENRQSTLALMADRVGVAPVSPAAGAGVPRSDPGPRPPGPAEPPTLKLGPAAPVGGDAVTRPRSSLDDDATPRTGAARSLQAAGAQPLRQQFAALEGSIARLESAQVRLVGSLSGSVRATVETVRTALSGLGLNVRPVGDEARPKPVRLSKRNVDPFDAQVSGLEEDLGRLQLWRAAADAVPLRRPVEGDNNLTSNFGSRKDPFTGATAMHAGMDFRGPIGTPIRASAAGRVITADVSSGYGNLVEVEHGNGVVTRYGHLSAINVAAGQTVTPGVVVGLLGSTGRSTGPHLHYETRINGSAVDPVRFLTVGAHLFDQPAPAEGVTATEGADDAAFD